eukprot:TRINITY_DN4145_c0_g1_i1.p1 TRINITY_DN4145_c0_g1~~TRINITY_DN4145_c0_g1_i1.p1  ORF type:complete len:149 (-),score=32.09 TRINITY_DN4145_c0_g1_i1:122-568(-)
MPSFTCACGDLTVKFGDAPKASGICHCKECRDVTGSDLVRFVAFAPDDVSFEGNKTEFAMPGVKMTRTSCPKCGELVANTNKFGLQVLGVQAARRMGDHQNLSDDIKEAWAPKFHLWYQERLVNVKDDLPKFLDFPEAFGGTGKMFEE